MINGGKSEMDMLEKTIGKDLFGDMLVVVQLLAKTSFKLVKVDNDASNRLRVLLESRHPDSDPLNTML